MNKIIAAGKGRRNQRAYATAHEQNISQRSMPEVMGLLNVIMPAEGGRQCVPCLSDCVTSVFQKYRFPPQETWSFQETVPPTLEVDEEDEKGEDLLCSKGLQCMNVHCTKTHFISRAAGATYGSTLLQEVWVLIRTWRA